MNPVRYKVAERIKNKPDIWSNILISTYVLIQKDRIGQYGIEKREGVPGIWGHSYVKTYYNWVDNTPTDKVRMEGGIATSYYVLNALNKFYKKVNSKIDSKIIDDVVTFLEARTTSGGIGIQTTSYRGTPQVAANLRHTSFGYLIMSEVESLDPSASKKLANPIKNAIAIILNPLTPEDLLNSWLSESWPIGGIASYIASKDHIFKTRYNGSYLEEKKIWKVVRKNLIESLAELNSLKLHFLSSPKPEFGSKFIEHYPFWHPIFDRPTLRLHSTLGCLKFVGKELSSTPQGQARIKKIVQLLKRLIFNKYKGAPRFSKDSPPSFSAASAMLTIILGEWYEPESEDFELINTLLSFMENNWSNPDVYQDYWSEFTAPLLAIDEIYIGLGDTLYTNYNVSLKINEILNKNLILDKLPSEYISLIKKINKILPIALGVIN